MEKLKDFLINVVWSFFIFIGYNGVAFISGRLIFSLVDTQYNKFAKPPYTDENNLMLIIILIIIWFIIQNIVVWIFFKHLKKNYSQKINFPFIKLFFELFIALLAVLAIMVFDILESNNDFLAPYFLITVNLISVPLWIDYIFSSSSTIKKTKD